jgi:metal-responsive CopG/Arc/MetJ family transcriptional regulator
MKSKTSLTLSPEVLAAIDRLAGRRYSRSEVIDRVLRDFLQRREQERVDAEEIEKINGNANYWNKEMRDVLSYQTLPDFDEEK